MFVCLAAGRGKRMGPLSSYLHKAMIPFFGVPFLAYSILSIPKHSKIVIIVNHLKEQIVNYFGESYKGRKIRYFTQSNPQGTGDALVQFSKAFQPRRSVIVWQADQMIFPEEIALLSRCEPNSSLNSETVKGMFDLGLWKIKPSTLRVLKDHFDGAEYRALPALEKRNLNRIFIKRDKLEISFNSWEKIELKCKLFRQKFRIEFQ